MKKFITTIAAMMFAVAGFAQSTMEVTLHGANFDKANSTNDLYVFTDAAGFTLGMENRDVNKTPSNWTDPDGNSYTDGINFKNNATGTINVPEGYQVTKLVIGGCAQSDNRDLNYLYSVTVDGTEFFVEPIGKGMKDDATIESTAKYVMKADGTAPEFASIDLSASPAKSSVAVIFSGNVQSDVWFKITYSAVSEGTDATGTTSATLHGANFDQANSTNDLYVFTDAEDFTLGMDNRDVTKTPCSWTDPNGVSYTDGINFKNNAAGTINVPTGKKVYGMAIGGCSQSDAGNLCYLYTVDKDGVNVFTDAIGQNEKDNSTIQSTAKYPILPDGNAPQFAYFDFTDSPATSTIKVVFSGNNQEDVWFTLYLTEAAADAAATGISRVNTERTAPADGLLYNMAGQRVSESYRGLVIKNGRKYIK